MKLYKYVITERIDVLEGRHIRFTQPKYLNDPFDLQPKFEHLLPESTLEKVAQEASKNLSVNKTLKSIVNEPLQAAISQASPERRVELEKFQEEIEEMFRQTPEEEEQERNLKRSYSNFVLPIIKQVTGDFAKRFPSPITENAGVLSLTEKPDNLLMWAHYADSHRGFVIEFDGSNSFFNFPNKPEKSALHKVVYKERKNIKHIDDFEDDEDAWLNLFLVKSKIWEYEQEWRILKSLNDADKTIGSDIYLFAFPAECVTRIIFGHSMSDAEKLKFLSLKQKYEQYTHIELAQARIRNDTDDLAITSFGLKQKLGIFRSLLLEVEQKAEKLKQDYMWFTATLHLRDVVSGINATAKIAAEALLEIDSGKQVPETTVDSAMQSVLEELEYFQIISSYFKSLAHSNMLNTEVCVKPSISLSEDM